MGKKSAIKVATSPVAVAVVQSGKKGKRGVENKVAKAVSAKKQKVERYETIVAKQKVEKKLPKKAASSSEDDESDDSDSEIEPKVVAKKTPTPAKNNAKKDNSSDSDASGSDSDISDDKPVAKKAPLVVKNGSAAVKKGSTLDSSEASDSDSEDEDDDDEKVAAQPKKVTNKPAELNDSSDSGEGSSDEDDEASGEDESDEEENEQSLKTPKKGGDVEMVDAASTFQKTPKTPATSEATGSKTLFVANLAFSVEESDVREFFKDVGEVVDIRFASNAEGQFRGFGHVDFATAEAAQKALELHDQPLLNRPVRLDLASEKGDRSASRENNSFQKGGKAQGQTAFVRGFDTSLGEDEIRSALQEHFGVCGEITRVSIPKDFESGGVKGMAYLDFADSNGFKEALGMDGSDLGGGFCLNVQEAKPKGDSAGGSGGGRFGGGRSGGRGGGGRFSGGRGGGGRFSGRGGRDGGRFSGRGGRDGGRGRGRGRSNFTGKKTTF